MLHLHAVKPLQCLLSGKPDPTVPASLLILKRLKPPVLSTFCTSCEPEGVKAREKQMDFRNPKLALKEGSNASLDPGDVHLEQNHQPCLKL